MGLAVAGTPATVRDALARLIGEAGVTYLVCRFAFGDMALAELLRSLELFAQHVMPELRAVVLANFHVAGSARADCAPPSALRGGVGGGNPQGRPCGKNVGSLRRRAEQQGFLLRLHPTPNPSPSRGGESPRAACSARYIAAPLRPYAWQRSRLQSRVARRCKQDGDEHEDDHGCAGCLSAARWQPRRRPVPTPTSWLRSCAST